MATPLLQSIFTPTDFDTFLDEVGFGHMSAQARLKLVDDMSYAVQYGVMTRILTELKPEQKLRLIELMQEAKKTGDFSVPNNYVSDQFPDLEVIVDEIIERVKSQLRPGRVSLEKIMDEFFDAAEKRVAYEKAMLPSEPKSPTEQSSNSAPVPPAAAPEPAVADLASTAPLTPVPAPRTPISEPAASPEATEELRFPWEVDVKLKAEEENDQSYQQLLQQLQHTAPEGVAGGQPTQQPAITDSGEAIDDELKAIDY